MPRIIQHDEPRVTENEVETFSGEYVDVSNPEPGNIRLDDVAHALANTCRFGGHCKTFYSVAEHAVFVSMRLERKGGRPALCLSGLHHDDAEAYLGDIPRPLKPLLGFGYEALTNRMDEAIADALLLPAVDSSSKRAIKREDNWALFVEAKHLLPSGGDGWWDGEQGSDRWGIGEMPGRIVTPDYWHGGQPPELAKERFLQRHKYLTLSTSAAKGVT